MDREYYADCRISEEEIDILKEMKGAKICGIYQYDCYALYIELEDCIIAIDNELIEPISRAHDEYATLSFEKRAKFSVDFTKCKELYIGSAINDIALVLDERWWHETDWETYERDYIHAIAHVAVEFFSEEYCLVITLSSAGINALDASVFKYKEDYWHIGSNPWLFKSEDPDKLIRTRIEL